MNFPVLTSVLIFVVILTIFNHRNSKIRKQKLDDYYKKEQQANFVRKKSLDDLEYISIPLDEFPMDVATDHAIIQDCIKTIQSLSSEKIVNFTGYTNTDLKLAYGTANITSLTQYDLNYTLFVRTLQSWGKELYQLGYKKEAQTVLEYAIKTRTDISGSYYLLASIYKESGQENKIKHLLLVAETLQSAMKNSIVHTLKESYPDIC